MLDMCVEILSELNEWGPVFTLWSNSEDKLSGALSGVAKAIEKCYVALQELVSYSSAIGEFSGQPLVQFAVSKNDNDEAIAQISLFGQCVQLNGRLLVWHKLVLLLL